MQQFKREKKTFQRTIWVDDSFQQFFVFSFYIYFEWKITFDVTWNICIHSFFNVRPLDATRAYRNSRKRAVIRNNYNHFAQFQANLNTCCEIVIFLLFVCRIAHSLRQYSLLFFYIFLHQNDNAEKGKREKKKKSRKRRILMTDKLNEHYNRKFSF